MTGKVQSPPNDSSRRERTRKANKCQWCETKVPIAQQLTVFNDLDANKVKTGKASAHPDKGHWCKDCADKRVQMSQAWLDSRNGKPKKAAAAKASKKAVPKATKKAARKVRKPAKAAAAKSADPF